MQTRPKLAGLALVVLAVAGGWWLTTPSVRTPAPAIAPAASASADLHAPASETASAAVDTLRAGATLRVTRAQFESSSEWLGTISLGYEAEPGEVLEGRVLVADGSRAPLAIVANVPESGSGADSRRGEAKLTLPAAWLEPGLYVVEIRTRERTHFPLRRYALEIR